MKPVADGKEIYLMELAYRILETDNLKFVGQGCKLEILGEGIDVVWRQNFFSLMESLVLFSKPFNWLDETPLDPEG